MTGSWTGPLGKFAVCIIIALLSEVLCCPLALMLMGFITYLEDSLSGEKSCLLSPRLPPRAIDWFKSGTLARLNDEKSASDVF